MVSIAVTAAQVLRRRFERHHLAAADGRAIVDVARRVSGLHAQLMNAAYFALQTRMPSATPAKVRDALYRKHTLVKTWAARGTLHLLPAADLPVWVAAMSTRRRHVRGSWLKYHGVTADDMTAIFDALPAALDGRTLTRDELTDEIVRISGRRRLAEPLRSGWGAVLKPAAFHGLVCFGEPRGRNVTFVAPRAVVPAWREVSLECALDTLVRAYLDAYGPSTPEEFSRWFDLDARSTKQTFARLAGELVEVTIDGHGHAVALASSVDELRRARPRGDVRLLAGFDPYVVGALRQLPMLLPDGVPKAVVSRPSGWIAPVVAVDGAVVGTWSSDKDAIDVELFVKQPKKVATAIDDEVERARAVLGRERNEPPDAE